MERIKEEQEAYQEGYSFYCNNKFDYNVGSQNNPYDINSEENLYNAWSDGYSQAGFDD